MPSIGQILQPFTGNCDVSSEQVKKIRVGRSNKQKHSRSTPALKIYFLPNSCYSSNQTWHKLGIFRQKVIQACSNKRETIGKHSKYVNLKQFSFSELMAQLQPFNKKNLWGMFLLNKSHLEEL